MSRIPHREPPRIGSTQWRFVILVSSLLAGVVGCGSETYEERLKQTKQYFEYLEQVNQALVPKAIPLESVEIRPPQGFDLIPFPPPPKDDQPAEPVDPANDPTRMGYEPDVELEGVLATFRAKVRVNGGSDNGTAFAYLHVLSNKQRWLDKPLSSDIEPLYFLTDITNVVATVCEVVSDTTESPWDWERMGGFSPFVPKKKVERVLIQSEKESLANVDVLLHRLDVKDTQVVILLIVPRSIDPRERLEQRFKHTLETLKVSGQAPQRKSSNAPTTAF